MNLRGLPPLLRYKSLLPALFCATVLLMSLAQPAAIHAGDQVLGQPAEYAADHGVEQAPGDGRSAWTDIADINLPAAMAAQVPGEVPAILPQHYRLLVLDTAALQMILGTAPLAADAQGLAGAATVPSHEGTPSSTTAPVLALPMPQGSFARFTIEVSPVLDSALQAQHPDWQTYRGRGIDDPAATLRLGLTTQGFHAIVLSGDDTVYITRLGPGPSPLYLSYYAGDYDAQEAFVCGVGDEHAVHLEIADTDQPADQPADQSADQPADQSADGALRAELRRGLGTLQPALPAGSSLRTYRLAVAATGEYTADAATRAGLVNPTGAQKAAAALDAIVTQINLVNAIYEREVSLHFELVAGTANVIYTDPATDPYTNDRLDLMLGQNRATLDAVIGSEDYEVGHVLGTAGGGVAFIGVACNNTYKAGGASGPGAAATPYTVMVIAHEMGHQFGAYHTFNARSGGCGGGNRSPNSAYEPGSGSTIMSYSSLCGAEQNLPGYYTSFHVTSFDQMVDYSRNRTGSLCGVATSTGNEPPTVNAGADFTIPARTPFVLSGTAADPDGQPLTYSWQQVDLMTAAYSGTLTLQEALTDYGSGPLYRVYPFTPGGASRTYPALANVLSGTVELGETYPTTNRTLNFRLFARDNQAAGGGANYDSARVTVINTKDAFSVTAPAAGASWPGGLLREVRWNVAGTTVAPISCAEVALLYSGDGGATFAMLVAATPNDGNEWVPAPTVPSTDARIQVRCAGNIFYNVSGRFTVRANSDGGVLAGTVRNSANAPIGGAQVSVSGPDAVAVATDAEGRYTLQLPLGVYTVTVTAYGYDSDSAGGIAVNRGATTTRDVTLRAVPQRTVNGRVTDAGHGYGLYASLHFTTALNPIWTNPLTGIYTATVLEGAVYTVTASAWASGYAPSTQVWQPGDGTAALDIALAPNLAICRTPGYTLSGDGCAPLPGGLLVGNTFGRSGAPLAGVTVTGAGRAVSSTVTADPLAPDSFYNLFLPSGVLTVTAAAPGLIPVTTTVAVAVGEVLQRDFNWQQVYADASLRSLQVESGKFAPTFSPGVIEYRVDVPHDASSLLFAFTVNQPGVTIRFNGASLPPDANSATATLQPGANQVTIEVTALDGTTRTTYTVEVSRAPWPNTLYLPALRR